MNNDIITIVVPVYNVEPYIHRCVDSILKQSYKSFELVLVDDGSPDDCPRICDEYAQLDRRITVIHQDNGGLSAARNTGIDWSFEHSESRWITFIDSDDWIHPEYLRLLYDAVAEKRTEVSIGKYEVVYDGTIINDSNLISRTFVSSAEQYWIEDRTNATVAWGKLYRKSLFENIRYPVGKYHEDEFVTYRLLFAQDDIAVVDAKIYRYYHNDKSISRMNYIKRLPDVLECINQHLNYFQNSPWQKAYRLEVETYAGALSDAVWMLKDDKNLESVEKVKELRATLKSFIKEHGPLLPFSERKDIYISAYPRYKLFIRLFGFIKKKIDEKKVTTIFGDV